MFGGSISGDPMQEDERIARVIAIAQSCDKRDGHWQSYLSAARALLSRYDIRDKQHHGGGLLG